MKRHRSAGAGFRRRVEDLLAPLWARVNGHGSDERQRLGREGERIARNYLRQLSYRVVARNFRAVGAEIDLVMMDGDTVVFVEVKRRTDDSAGTPQEAVNSNKQDQIRRAAEVFIVRNRAGNHRVRFDVVAISGAGRDMHIEHLKDAF